MAARQLLCERLVRCEPKLDARAGPLFEPRLCHPAEPGYAAFVAATDAAVDAGRARYDDTAAQRCLAALRAMTARGCGTGFDELFPDEPACGEALSGTVPDGGACELSLECGAGSLCQVESSCPGTCVPLRLSGESCDDSDDCAGELVCVEGLCAAPLEAGAPCDDSDACGAGLECLRAPGAASTCRVLSAAGESCFVVLGRSTCDGDLVCEGASGDQPGVCGEGGPIGADCSAEAPCAPGGRCLGGSCVALAPPGGPCESSIGCPFSFGCAGGRCVPGPALGEACTTRCAQGACVDGSCAPLPPGAACEGALTAPLGECDEGRCSGGLGAGTCEAWNESGASCGADDQCGGADTCRRSLASGEELCLPTCL